MKRESVFFITVFGQIKENPTKIKIEKSMHPYIYTGQYTVGCFPTIERCRDIVKHNICDIYDNAGYEYAVIEEISFDEIYPAKLHTEVYKARHYKGEIPQMDNEGNVVKMHERQLTTYEPAELNEEIKANINNYTFAM